MCFHAPGWGDEMQIENKLNGPLSAASKPTVDTKEQFFNIFRDLEVYIPLHRSELKILQMFTNLTTCYI